MEIKADDVGDLDLGDVSVLLVQPPVKVGEVEGRAGGRRRGGTGTGEQGLGVRL